ncbi:NrtR DNA-binding winged helix domain-containing protein [Pontibacter sp. G13]|uniref:NUDIX hydrolase n=1 Tax=Pontibacter sp. G13 TaxID=3074898 RepID=UPI002889D935|nr:NUDIX domain-containing protein [Pontibacter sp. G13]WNJ17348.1 NUDIX domain-containing protein [Pontibacter sp. G13]
MESTFSNSHYGQADRHLVAVDCIIFGYEANCLQLLLFKRKVEPSAGKWSLLGRFVQHQEGVTDAAMRVVFELTGLKDIFLEQLASFGHVNRDEGARVISIAHFALIRKDDYDVELLESHGASWHDLNNLPELVFDHREMVDMALNSLRQKSRYLPLAFQLLPPKFTIPQLRALYETVFQTPFDRWNFRKRMINSGLLIKLEEKDKSASKKGAHYFQFDWDTYHKQQSEGISPLFL